MLECRGQATADWQLWRDQMVRYGSKMYEVQQADEADAALARMSEGSE